VVGNPVATAKVYNLREVDEMVVLDIAASREGGLPDFAAIRRISSVNFVPLTVGGGIRDVDTAKRLLRNCGADKIALGQGSYYLAQDIADAIGRQSVVIVVSDGLPDRSVLASAGEIILQSRELDGTQDGYDLERIRRVVEVATVPVVASSGCGSYLDMHNALTAGADAVAAGAFWQFTQNTPAEGKRYLGDKGWEVRIV
jgi:cyclase